MSRFRIGIDLLGGELTPSDILPVLLPLLEPLRNQADFFFFAAESDLHGIEDPWRKVARESVLMTDSPVLAARKKHSSLALAIHSLQKGQIDALISMANTGALQSMTKLQLKTISPIKRPALLTSIPTKGGSTTILDLGANVAYTASDLMQFALIGLAYQKTQGIPTPRLGLLNIGREPLKGPRELRIAYEKLEKMSRASSPSFFQGNVESLDIFSGAVDLVITDGFTGNIFLKSAEGMRHFLLSLLPPDLAQKLGPGNQKGAILCGLQELVIKCHGNAKPQALYRATEQAIELLTHHFLSRLQTEIAHLSSIYYRFL